jgi:prepilin-type N-terminal cleavage/methylation domain-containing protein
MNYKKYRAFSLIELSIVILIIGILVAGVTQSSRLIRQMKIAAAQNLTRSSPVPNRNLMFWWETTLDESFLAGEATDGGEVTQLNDNNPMAISKINGYRGQKTTTSAFNYDYSAFSAVRGPSYIANGINGMPSLRFFNSGQGVFLQTDNKFKTSGNENLLMFLVIKYRSGIGWVVDRVCQSSSGNGYSAPCPSSQYLGMPLFGLLIDTRVLGFLRDNNTLSPAITSNGNAGSFLTSQAPFLVTVERKYRQTFSIYINGKLETSSVDNQGIANIDMVKLGRHIDDTANDLSFDMSEFIYYVGSIANEDRDAIEEYLGKKYGLKISNN